jgi:1,4-alpha-glucan branching enzyme
MPQGFLAMILHAHLPYVRHPEHGRFLEERWFHEAVTETYLPLLWTLERLLDDGVDFRLTLNLSPTLIAMFNDDLLRLRYVRHLESLNELADREVRRTGNQPEFHDTALLYRDLFSRAYRMFTDKYRHDLTGAFRRLQDSGQVEIITTGATHGYLPLLGVQREAVHAQVAVAVQFYERNFGKAPEGFWLPECGYHPGDDRILGKFGIKYFITESHGLLHASPRPKYGYYAPVRTPAGVAAFGRDMESSKQVWSAKEGYPGDFDYRDFYRDIGYDLDLDYVGHYLPGNSSGGDVRTRSHTGFKYHRITGLSDHKEPYVRRYAMDKAALHAGNFMFNREKQIEWLAAIFDRQPVVVAPYDAELFGHWWFEGPQWLDFLCRKICFDQRTLAMITPSEYLGLYPRSQVSAPSESSWGWQGYHEVWLNGANDWIWRHLHKAAERMVELANTFNEAEGDLQRALNQAARELLLAQASDWPFIMKSGTMVEYARLRLETHIADFTRLYEEIRHGRIDTGRLAVLEQRDNLFPEIDYRVYQSRRLGELPRDLPQGVPASA